jgi:hypothetical protein
MARRPLLLLSTLTLLAGYSLVSGCGSDKGFSTGTADDSMGAGSGSAADCTATFTWWQKDAYLNSPGRNDPAWPPHTTTELQVSCGGQVVATASMTNHGTPFGTTNDAGVPMLTDMQQATVSGTQAQLTSLLSTYQACECDPTSPGGPGTVFLSAQPPSPVMGQVLSIVESYLEQNLTCTAATSVTQIGNMLEAGNFDGARAAISGCTWSSGASFEHGVWRARVGLDRLSRLQQRRDAPSEPLFDLSVDRGDRRVRQDEQRLQGPRVFLQSGERRCRGWRGILRGGRSGAGERR